MAGRTVSAFELWRNPILVRYARARLRWKGLLFNGVPTLLLALFFFLIAYLLPQQAIRYGSPLTLEETREIGGRAAFLAVFAVQCVLLMLRGTFSVAVGITREGVEGILEYQRLTPMSPLAKIVGYVFGLPIQETFLFLLTIPFTAFAIGAGDIPWELTAKLYAVMGSSVLLYHMTGFLAGIAVKNRFMAGFLSQLLMIVLYLLLPQLSRLGYVLFEYLTVWPLVIQTTQQLFERYGDGPVLRETESFFDAEIPLVWFTFLVQGFLLLSFLLVAYRRVRNEEAHLLGKFSAIPVVGGLVTILLGVALPGIATGNMFPSRAAGGMLQLRGFFVLREPLEPEMILIPGFFGLGLMLLILVVLLMITPSEEQRIKGLRLARKLGKRSVPWYSDAASSVPTALMCAAIAIAAWLAFIDELLASRWYAQWSPGPSAWLLFPAAMLVPILCYQLALEVGGRQFWFFGVIFAWIVPLMAAIVMGLAMDAFPDPVVYILSISGFTTSFNAVRAGFEGLQSSSTSAVIWWSLFLNTLALLCLIWWAVRKRRELRRITMGEERSTTK